MIKLELGKGTVKVFTIEVLFLFRPWNESSLYMFKSHITNFNYTKNVGSLNTHIV